MAIRFHYLAAVTLRERNRLKTFLIDLFRKEKQALESLDIIFCSDDYLLEINRSHLQHDYYTDIITFNLASSEEPVMGELYISIDRVKDNAAHFSSSSNRELHRVIFHGALHLCGYKDKSKNDIAQMRAKEEQYLNAYF